MYTPLIRDERMGKFYWIFSEEDALPSEEDRGIGHKIKVRDEVLSPDNDDEELVKEMFSKTCFGAYMQMHDCSVQARLVRCFMSLELEESSKDALVICVNRSTLRFILREFVIITGLNCIANEDDFVIENKEPNRIVFRIVNTRIHGMPLAMKVWLYECYSAVDPKIIVKRGSRISRLLNWETTDRRPHFEAFIEGMLADVDNPVKAESGDLRKLIIDNFKSVMEAIKSIKIAEKGPNVEAAADIPTIPQSSPQDISVSRFSVPNQSDTSTVELQRGHNVEAVEDIPVVSCNAPENGSRSVTRCLRLRVALS
ncbi:hypothetical protein FXO37_32137 [Capsicum annuum]|nr:hypothetical protein FXO37_32137 [Capsicum annuum]